MPNKACPLTQTEEEVLWQCRQLGDHNPRSLLNTIWFFVCQQYGMRGRELHHALSVTEFTFKTDEKDRTYIDFIQGPSKTFQGGLYYKQRQIMPRMYATNGKRCPVAFFQKFISKRPPIEKIHRPSLPISNRQSKK